MNVKFVPRGMGFAVRACVLFAQSLTLLTILAAGLAVMFACTGVIQIVAYACHMLEMVQV